MGFPQYYIFNHVPKTGGNSLLAVCRHNLSEPEISPHLWEHNLTGGHWRQFEHYRLVRGHFSLAAQRGFARDRYSITLLRHPIRTIASTYNFWRVAPEQPANDAVSIAKMRTFADFVRYFTDSTAIIENPYAHHFASILVDFPSEPDENTLLETAKHNLAAFDFVGITEQFAASAGLLCEELGWQCPAELPRENASGSERLFDRIDSETMDLLVERNRLDLELYEYGKALFRQHCTQRNGNPGISDGAHFSHRENRTRIFAQSRQRIVEANHFLSLTPREAPFRLAVIQWVSAICKPGTLDIAIDFRTEARIENLVVGILITDAEGSHIYSTNTQIEKLEVQNAPDCNCSVLFTLECGIPAGLYFVTVALHDLHRYGYHYHWINRAARFQVTGNGTEHATGGGIRLREFKSAIG